MALGLSPFHFSVERLHFSVEGFHFLVEGFHFSVEVRMQVAVEGHFVGSPPHRVPAGHGFRKVPF